MKFIKKHISLVVAFIVLILIACGLLLVKSLFFSNDIKAIYGSRLEDIEKYEIKKETKENIKTSLGEFCSSSKVRIAGRIIYVDAVANDDVTLETAKALGDRVLANFTEEEKKYYDIQLMIKKNTETNQFPIIGYKHHSKSAIVWTKDRAES